MICISLQQYRGDHIKKKDGQSMWQIRERCIQGFGIGNVRETHNLQGL
jgi:hypothetical protein